MHSWVSDRHSQQQCRSSCTYLLALHETQLEKLLARCDEYEARLDAHGSQLDEHGSRLDEHCSRFDEHDSRLDDIDTTRSGDEPKKVSTRQSFVRSGSPSLLENG